MKFAFQMDPLHGLNFNTDSTWQLILEASKRGDVYYFSPYDLYWRNGELLANTQKITISKNHDFSLGEIKVTNLNQMDVIFIRQDPPYDMNYLTSTYLLEKLSNQVLLINSPKAIRDFPEKISVLDHLDLIPPTLITSSFKEAKSFSKNYNKVIVKPLYSFAGNDIFCLEAEDINFSSIVDNLNQIHKAPFIVQEFIPQVKHGDKRIILVNGKPVGSFLRTPSDASIKSNLACGGTASSTELNDRDLYICEKIAPMLIKNDLFLVGIDVIDKYLTEINVTSPTGLVMIQKFHNKSVTASIFDQIHIKVNRNLTKG